jgi:ABC-type Na+ efflux pump permease subunit
MRLMRTMILKEIRTMMRERHQKPALAAVFVLALVGILVPAYKWKTFVDHSRAQAEKSRAAAVVASARAGTRPATAEATKTSEAFAFVLAAAAPSQADLIREELLSNNAAVIRWIILLGTALPAMLFSLGLIGNAATAAFAGEKEAKTLELALASPASDSALFIGKWLAAIVPAAVFCYLLILLATCGAWLLLRGELATLPVNVPLHTLVLSMPLILLPSVALAQIGVAGSARAETVKGAGQVMGIAIIVIMLGGGMLGVLLRFTPVAPAAARAGRAWLQWPFPAQYLGLVAVLVVVDLILFAIGRAMVRRQRMLV